MSSTRIALRLGQFTIRMARNGQDVRIRQSQKQPQFQDIIALRMVEQGRRVINVRLGMCGTQLQTAEQAIVYQNNNHVRICRIPHSIKTHH